MRQRGQGAPTIQNAIQTDAPINPGNGGGALVDLQGNVVGIMLTTFGTFWSGESFGITWPLSDLFLLILAALYLVASALLILAIKQRRLRVASTGVTAQAASLAPEKGVQQ